MKPSFPLSLTGALAVSSVSMALAADAPSGPAMLPVAPSVATVPAWPPVARAPKGAPNIVLILLDDVGYSWSSVFGGPVATPNIDALASHGLRYNNFHVNALCSPTRASLLSGRNDHEIGFGTIADAASPAPGYSSIWPKSAASIAEVLKLNGYSTAAFGKWHNTPTWEVNPAGPFSHWPTSLGFEYFYGFVEGNTTQYEPELFRDTTPVDTLKTPEQGYILNTDLANDAIHWLDEHDAAAPGKPFFLYFATGAIHSPHHVTKDWIAKYNGKFDQGWDKVREETFARQKALGIIPANADLTPRPRELPAWDSLAANEKRLYSAQAEVYAAYLAETDFEVGRLLDELKQSGHVDDTVVFYIVGDNGASGEGGVEGTIGYQASVDEQLSHLDEFGSKTLRNHVASAWAWAADTPFQWMKQVASHLGGTTDPLIVSWPGHIRSEGGIRSQFSHVTDIAPTIYDIAHVDFPQEVDGVKQLPLEGSSLAYSFDDPNAPSKHNLQFFETSGNRGIYKDGWWAGSRLGLPWDGIGKQGSPEPWELYNLTTDFSQAHNLADRYPDKLKELEAVFDSEAARNQVYPRNAPSVSSEPQVRRTNWVYRGAVDRIPPRLGPRMLGVSHRITAEIEIGENTPNGVIVAEGGRLGGYTLFVKSGFVAYEETPGLAGPHTQIISKDPLPRGKSVIEVVSEFEPDFRVDSKPANDSASGKRKRRQSPMVYHDTIMVNGTTEAAGDFVGSRIGGSVPETLDIGSDTGSPVSNEYDSPNRFNGVVTQVTFSVEEPTASSLATAAGGHGGTSTPTER